MKRMTMEDVKKDKWYLSRPKVIQDFMDIVSPIRPHKFKDSGKHCYVVSIQEPISGKLEDVSCTVTKTGYGGATGFNPLDTNSVFGIKPADIEPLTEQEIEKYYPNTNSEEEG